MAQGPLLGRLAVFVVVREHLDALEYTHGFRDRWFRMPKLSISLAGLPLAAALLVVVAGEAFLGAKGPLRPRRFYSAVAVFVLAS